MKKIKRIISCAITICLTIGILTYLTDLMERSQAIRSMRIFGSKRKDLMFCFLERVI